MPRPLSGSPARVQLGDTHELEGFSRLISEASSATARDEAAVEAARAFADYGTLEKATHAAALLGEGALAAGYFGAWAVVMGTLALRRGESEAALSYALAAQTATVQDAAGKFRAQLLLARARNAAGLGTEAPGIAELIRIANAQSSPLLTISAELLDALLGSKSPESAIARLLPEEAHVLSVLAEEVCQTLAGARA